MAVEETWVDLGILTQYGFPYRGGAYLGFTGRLSDGQWATAEVPLTRGVVAGGLFRPCTQEELQKLRTQGTGTLPKWAWLIPQLRYRVYIVEDPIKEMLLMWTMGWEPSPEFLQALREANAKDADGQGAQLKDPTIQ